jgi:peptidoglycan/xylan/chitin deacetylase (PgdA/CDA1 family)
MYHDVVSDDRRLSQDVSFISPEHFDLQLDYLQKNYNIVSMETALSRACPEKAAVLTFDDGLRDHYIEVLPRLLARGLVGTFFIPFIAIEQRKLISTHTIQYLYMAYKNDVKDMIFDALKEMKVSTSVAWKKYSKSLWKNNTWTADKVFITRFLRTDPIGRLLTTHLFEEWLGNETSYANQLYLTHSQMLALLKNGMELGSHGMNSVNLTLLPDHVWDAELFNSASKLENLGVSRMFFSYPNGGFNKTIAACAKDAGYEAAVTTIPTTTQSHQNPFELPRLNAPRDLPI